MGQFNFKNFEEVRIIATYPMEIGNRSIDAGETIAMFDRIQIGGLNDRIQSITANGGYDNRSLIYWTSVTSESLTFSQGVLSKDQFALLNNARLVERTNATPILVSKREKLETNENAQVTLAETPNGLVYVYDADTGLKISSTVVGKVVTCATPFLSIIVDYHYNYAGNTSEFELGGGLLSGFVSLEGKTRVKDDTTGHIVTGIIKIPKLKLMSGLSIRLGDNADPTVSTFRGEATPVGARGNTHTSEFYILSDDIDSDI